MRGAIRIDPSGVLTLGSSPRAGSRPASGRAVRGKYWRGAAPFLPLPALNDAEIVVRAIDEDAQADDNGGAQ
jgi:hypothetical protein